MVTSKLPPPGECLTRLVEKCQGAAQINNSFVVKSLGRKDFTYQMAIEIFP